MATRSVNKVILVGNLVRDAETAFTASQVSVSKFTVATNRRWKDQASGEWKEESQFTNVVLWRNENLAPFLQKGKQVYCEGRIQTRSYEKDGKKQYVTEVVADDVILLGGRGGDSAPGPEDVPASRPRGAARQQPLPSSEIDDSDVPF